MAAILVWLAGACTSSPAPARPLPAAPAGATKPFDLFRKDDLALIQSARNRLTASCMSAAGYPQLARVQETKEPSETLFANLDAGAQLYGPTTEADARKYGFGEPAPAEPPKVVSFDPAFDAAHDKCIQESLRKLGVTSTEVSDQYTELGNRLGSELGEKLDPIAKDAFMSDIFGCLAEKGYDIVDRENPSIEQLGIKKGALENSDKDWEPEQKPGTVQVSPAVPRREYVPTEEEVEVAVAMVQCKEQHGFFSQIDESIETAQREIVERHATEFAELNPRIEAMAREAAKVVGR